jgi:cytochrome c oxidase subunit I
MAVTEVRTEAQQPAEEPHSRLRAVTGWLTTTDHKRIGILYIVTAFVFFLVGGALAELIRTQLYQPDNKLFGEHTFHIYNQLFTIHAITMIFLFVMPVTVGFANYIVPLQIGAADMAFPRVNAFSYWLFPIGGLTIYAGFLSPNGASPCGWTGYMPLCEQVNNPAGAGGYGPDLLLIGLLILGLSSLLGAINFIVTIFKMRAPGMTMFRVPIFVWTFLTTAMLLLLSMPAFTAALAAALIDRNFGGHFFDPQAGGSAILWQHIFWFFGHPEVYILILPSMGAVSEILPVFSGKPLFGYRAFVYATLAIGMLGFGVWAHHMFTTGVVYAPFFAFLTGAIAVPTGVKFFNWIATMWRGKVRFTTPMLFAIGFLMLFLIGGIDGVFTGSPPIDYHLQDTYWVVSHLHFVLFGGAVFGIFAAFYYWWPKMTGRFLSEGLGRTHFAFMFVGTLLTFFPMHMSGLEGMPRRIANYVEVAKIHPDITTYNQMATIGAYILGIGMLVFVATLLLSVRKPPTAAADAWGSGNSLEWATTSPPPPWNFDALPPIRSERPVFDARHPEMAVQHAVGAGEDRTVEADRPERPETAERDAQAAEEAEQARREEDPE